MLGIFVSVVDLGMMLMICKVCVFICRLLLRFWFSVFDIVILFGVDGV